jgi:hypothetical protein
VVLGVSLPHYSSFAYAPITLYGTDFQPSSTRLTMIWNAPRPRRPNLRFRLVRFRSPLLPQSRLFSSPRLTKMFQFSRCPPHTLFYSGVGDHAWCGRVSPFGFPRIKACLQLPVAFRRWPRPSSACCPKASAMCPFSASSYYLPPSAVFKAQFQEHSVVSRQETASPNYNSMTLHGDLR